MNIKRILCSLLFFALSFNLCSDDDATAGADSDGVELASSFSIGAEVADAAPSIQPIDGLDVKTYDSGWTQFADNPLYQIFIVFREYDEDRDQGVVDNNNLYRLLDELDFIFSFLESNTEAFAEPTAVQSTFTFNSIPVVDAVSAVSYDYWATASDSYRNSEYSMAYTQEGNSFTFVVAAEWDGTRLSMEGRWDKDSGELFLDFTYLLDYTRDPSSSLTETYVLRSHIEGNMTSGEFYVQVYKPCYTCSGDGSGRLVVGKGVSKGDNNYYVAYYKEGSDAKFYSIDATASETEYQATNPNDNGSETAAGLADDPEGYASWIQTNIIDAGKILDENNSPTEWDDFSSGTLELE